MKDLVSIIMLSRNSSRYVEESVRSVLAQTYTNWELLFVDDNSTDDTVSLLMQLMDEGRSKKEKWALERRIHVSQTVAERGRSANRNGALKGARGKWMAFIDAGDVWAPDKLEKQIQFMEAHGYAFSYTCYGLMDMESRNRGVIVGGKEHITHEDMLKCCWLTYLTVMYDAQKIGRVQVRGRENNNDYALWVNLSEKADCHLLAENLATLRTPWGLFGRFFRTDKLKWRYEVYRSEKGFGVAKSLWYTLRNGWYGMVKWFRAGTVQRK